MHELQERASWEMDSRGNWAIFTSGSSAANGAQRSSVLSSSEELIDLLADPQFSKSTKKGLDADVLIIAPYEAQRNLYEYELQRRASLELKSKGNWVRFDKSRIKIRTHQGAQGHEASVVIVDLTRSDSPGMTGHSQVVNVSSSRSICAMLILINTRILKNVESKNSPLVRNLVQWVQIHEDLGMFIEIDFETAKELRIVCRKCYAVGHKGTDCPFNKGKALFCMICGGKHHPRDCYRAKKDRAVEDVEETEQVEETTQSTTPAAPARETRNDCHKNAGAALVQWKKRFHNMGKPQSDTTGAEDNGGNRCEPSPYAQDSGQVA